MFFFPFAMQKKNFNFIKLFVSELRMYSTTRYVDKAIQIIKESRKKVSFEIEFFFLHNTRWTKPVGSVK